MPFMQPRIYLAGPDVFFPNAEAIGEIKKAICAAHGLLGIFPTDLTEGETLPALAHDDPGFGPLIAHICETHMRACDGMIAHLTPWRGVSADVGTAYELGFMRALGRTVMAYSNDAQSYLDRTTATLSAPPVWDASTNMLRTVDGYLVENFTPPMADNIMLDHAVMGIAPHKILRGTKRPTEADYYTDMTIFTQVVEAMAAHFNTKDR